MRILIVLSVLFAASLARAETPSPQAFQPLFELAGIRLLCEQSAPLLQRGLSAPLQQRLGQLFAADALCLDLARQIAPAFTAAQLQQAQTLLQSPLAQRFTTAERAVGENEAELSAYRQQLATRPPRAARLALVRRLDQAAQTTALAALLRYEVGKTQALLTLKARGESIDEPTLASKTTAQAQALRESSAQGVEAFMLYAYRQIPSQQLAEYAALYEQPPVHLLLKASVQALPAVFAARRALLK